MHPQITRLEQELKPLRTKLESHQVYSVLHDIQDVQILMEEHVFAVWDFMSLLKHLQKGLTCTETPWMPTGNPITRRLINEIVFEEESDVDLNGNPASHFEMYISAMKSAGAKTYAIESLLDNINAGEDISSALEQSGALKSTQKFVRTTFKVIADDKLHLTAAAFTFGREDLIPTMFRAIVKDINDETKGKLEPFIYYLERHIELDEEVHTPLAIQMLVELCEEDEQKWNEAISVAKLCMKARIHLWDGIHAKMNNKTLA